MNEVRVARENRKTTIALADRQLAQDIIKNPVIQIVTAYLVLEYAERQGWVGNIAASIAEGGVLAGVALQQMAPYMPELLESTTAGMESLAQIGAGALPLIASKGMA